METPEPGDFLLSDEVLDDILADIGDSKEQNKKLDEWTSKYQQTLLYKMTEEMSRTFELELYVQQCRAVNERMRMDLAVASLEQQVLSTKILDSIKEIARLRTVLRDLPDIAQSHIRVE
jgi:hypothetical protein